MAEGLPQVVGRQLTGLTRLPAHRQFGLVLGLASVAAIAIGALLWAYTPSYRVLVADMAEGDVLAATGVLDRNGIPYRLGERGGLLVPADEVHEARLRLATEGLPRAHGVGFELLEQEPRLGTSRLLESARYQRALEGELARSVVTLDSVESARVHLALPRESAFMRERTRPTASVLVHLHPGRQLDDAQVAGIVHMVASSVPELETERVTVVDQRGRLLSGAAGAAGFGSMPAQQLDYTRRVEEAYRQRVVDILAPLVGAEGLRVQVTAEVDFTQVERTQETFDSESPALRSEQLAEEESAGSIMGGVPGSLSNQPPGAAVVAEEDGITADAAPAPPVSRNRRSTRNFEVDRTIDHIRHSPATLSRLSIAVVVDDRQAVAEDGVRTRAERSAEEMEHLTALVREAVGLDEARGDRLNVINASFRELEDPPPEEPSPLWEQRWAQEAARYAAAGVGILLLVLMVLRPVLLSLAKVPAERQPAAFGAPRAALPASGSAAALVPGAQAVGAGEDAERELKRARQVAVDDPRLVAQVVRRWIGDDGK